MTLILALTEILYSNINDIKLFESLVTLGVSRNQHLQESFEYSLLYNKPEFFNLSYTCSVFSSFPMKTVVNDHPVSSFRLSNSSKFSI